MAQSCSPGGSRAGSTGDSQTLHLANSDASASPKAKRLCIGTEDDERATDIAVESRPGANEPEGSSVDEERAHSAVASQVPVTPSRPMTLETDIRLGFCEKHQKPTDIWCNTCTVQVCKKCYRVDHKPPCDWFYVDEKCEELSEKFAAHLKTLKGTILPSFVKLETESAEKLRHVSLSIDEAKDLKLKLLKFQGNLPVIKKEYEDMFASYENIAQISEKKLSIKELLKNLESLSSVAVTYLPDVPSNLLLQQLSSYQCTKDAVRNPLETISLEEELGGGFLASLHHIYGRNSKIIKQAAESLKDGQLWVIHDATSAAAVVFSFRYTSKRPNLLKVKKIRWQQEELEAFKGIFAQADRPVQFCLTEDDWENDSLPTFLNIFCQEGTNAFPSCTAHLVLKDCFWKPDEDSFEKTSSRLNLVLAQKKSFRLEQVWGHLDDATLLKLPDTVESLGMLVRDEDDMFSVNNMMFKIAFKLEGYHGRVTKQWPALREIHLCVNEALDEADWDLRFCYDEYGQTKILGVNSFKGLVKIAIHFSFVTHASIPRVMRIFSDLSVVKDPKQGASLYLPGSKLSADAVLGVLRDHHWQTDVHLPAAHRPKEEDRISVDARYSAFNCSVHWDLDPLLD